LSALHTLDATETINRMIDLFQPHERVRCERCWRGRSGTSWGSV
jgi:Tfp pilus assembly pilus retraction ATPase PilT